MAKDNREAVNPYHYVLHCLGGKWKMTIVHEIYTYGHIRFNQTLKVLPLSEKVLSQQLKELVSDGLVERVVDGTQYPPLIYYKLTPVAEELIPALDLMYVWSVRRMKSQDIPIDTDAYVVHQSERYVNALSDILDSEEMKNLSRRRIHGDL